MGKYYFDQGAADAQLNNKGDQDYKNYDGAGALRTMELYEKTVNAADTKVELKYVAPEVRVNLERLGFDKTILDSSLHYTNTGAGTAHLTVESASRPDHQTSPHSKGPFGDPTLDQAFRAMQTGGEAQLTIAAQRMLDSPAGQKLMHTGNELLAQQQGQEQSAPTQQAPAETR